MDRRWIGGFIWVLILSVVSLVQPRPIQAAVGLLIACLACAAIMYLAVAAFAN